MTALGAFLAHIQIRFDPLNTPQRTAPKKQYLTAHVSSLLMFSRFPLFSAIALLFLATGLASAIPNDQFGAASDLGSATSASASLDTRLATRQVGEPSHDNNTSTGTSWWKWTAPADGQWTITHDESISSSYDLAVYTGENLDDLVLVGEEGGDPLVVNLIAGISYACALAREGISKLDFTFHLLLLDYRYAEHPKFFARLRVDLDSDARE